MEAADREGLQRVETLMIEMWRSGVRSAMRREGGPLMWMLPLYQKSDYDYDDEELMVTLDLG